MMVHLLIRFSDLEGRSKAPRMLRWKALVMRCAVGIMLSRAAVDECTLC